MKFKLFIYLSFLFLLFFHSCGDSKNDSISPEVKFEKELTQKFNFNFDFDGKTYTDLAVLMLPKEYHSDTPNKLIIYCHSGGGFVNNTSSEAETQDYTRYFVSVGYAVLDVNGIPDEIVKAKKIDVGRTVGNGLTLAEYVEAFNITTSKYNIDKEHIYVFSNSNGGAIASNIVNLTNIKVKAQAGICPLLSIKENAWFVESGKVASGEFSSFQNRSNIIRLYGMKDAITQAELFNAKYEEEKVGKYDPLEFVRKSKQPYKTVYKIFQPKDDTRVLYKYATEFANLVNKNGKKVTVRSFENGGHTSEPQLGSVGLYKYRSTSYNLTPTVYEVAKWFEENGGNIAKIN